MSQCRFHSSSPQRENTIDPNVKPGTERNLSRRSSISKLNIVYETWGEVTRMFIELFQIEHLFPKHTAVEETR